MKSVRDLYLGIEIGLSSHQPIFTSPPRSRGRSILPFQTFQSRQSTSSPRRTHRPIPLPSSLHVIAVHAGRRPVSEVPFGSLLLAVVVDIDDIERVDVAGQEGEDGQADIDEEVGAAAGDDVDAHRRDWIWPISRR